MSKHTMTLTKKQWQVMHDCLCDYWNLTLHQPKDLTKEPTETRLSKRALRSMDHIYNLLKGDV